MDAGKPILMASLVRLTCEAYLLVDPTKGTPRDRYLHMLMMQREAAIGFAQQGTRRRSRLAAATDRATLWPPADRLGMGAR
jgi:hypothetical protein